METLIIFAVIFVPFFWYIWVTLRFTRDTIGENSPLKVRRTYRATFWSYFTNIDYLFSYYTLIMGCFLFKTAFTVYIPPGEPYPYLARLLILVVSLLILSIGAYLLIIALNHWRYIADVTIDALPEEHGIDITFSDTVLRLTRENLISIDIFMKGGKMPLGYMKYHLSNGDHFVLSDKMPGAWVIQEYFKQVPVNYQTTRFPIIR